MKSKWLTNNQPVACIGDPNQGKTNAMFYLASLIDRDVYPNFYTFGYPKHIEGFTQLSSLGELNKIQDAVLIIDEIQKYFKLYEKKSNEALMEMLSFCEHRNIKLMFSTQLSQFITKQCEAFIPCWCIKRINIHTLKNGSTPSRIIKTEVKHPKISQFGLDLSPGEFIWYNMYGDIGETGIYDFPDMKVGKDWGNKNDENKPNTSG